MTPALTDAMVDGMDDMVGLLLKPQPAFVFAPSGIKHDRPPTICRIKGLATIRPQGIPIVGREQGAADWHRHQAMKLAGI